MTAGEVALVLHTHLPWVGGHGVWPVGEEWLHQVWAHSWLPVTRALLRLADDGHRDVLTLGVTPMVAAQLADPRLARDTGTWIGGQMWRAEEQRWHWWIPEPLQALSHHHWRHHQELLAFHEQVEARGGLLAVWARLQQDGVVELLGGPATHPFLPELEDPAAVAAQLRCGLDAHAAWAGERPRGIWPPELAYRPGLETLYADAGITHVLVDRTTPDRVAHAPLAHEARIGDGPVVGFVRDLVTTDRVWAPGSGYPSDPWYRDFHTQGTFGAHRSHRVTGLDVPWQEKGHYEPEAAAARVAAHVADMHALLHDRLATTPGAAVVAAYDTELLGHWWYEGPAWLEGLLRAVHADPALRTTTLSGRLDRRPPAGRRSLPRSTWGVGGDDRSWVTPATAELWARVRAVEARAHRAAAGVDPRGRHRDVVAQLARELAQLRCSDWPYMVARDQSPTYALDRVRHHADAAEELSALLEEDRAAPDRVAALTASTPAPADADALITALVGHRT